jgi:hypothetical protein
VRIDQLFETPTMIASALRTEIQEFLVADSDRRVDGELARVALDLLARGRHGGPAALLACQAFCESLVAHFEGRSLDRFEAMLDAIDDLVVDPAELPALRESLRRFTTQLEQLRLEATRAPRRQSERHVSAA